MATEYPNSKSVSLSTASTLLRYSVFGTNISHCVGERVGSPIAENANHQESQSFLEKSHTSARKISQDSLGLIVGDVVGDVVGDFVG